MAADPDLLARNIDAAIAQLEATRPLAASLARAADLVAQCLLAGHKLLACGNGGSSADAAHFATEFVVRYKDERPPYPAICLGESGGVLTAMVNDYDPSLLFARQVEAYGRPGDVLVVLSTSGKSVNVRLALEKARDIGIKSIALLGRDGGDTRGLATIDLIVPGTVTARIQEAHKVLYHTLCEMIEPRLAEGRG